MMSYRKAYIGVIFLFVLLCNATVVEANEGSKPHHISLFVGSTKIDTEGSGATFGIDYEYRVSRFLGLGVVTEYAQGELDAWTTLAVADMHITDRWIVQAGPGFERAEGHERFVGRIGFLYEFENEGWTFSPQFHYDIHEASENAYVVGFAVGVPF